MVQLQVETGKGITFAIRDGLKNQGVDVSSIDASTWNSIMTEVSSENDTKKSNGKKELYTGGNDLFGSTRNNFVVNKGAINLEETTWNKIVNIVQNKPVAKVEQKAPANEGKQASFIQADAESGRQSFDSSSRQTFTNLGATVSDWDENICTVSKDGHTMKFKVDNQGNCDIIGEKEGDILYLMSLLESDPAQIEAARKRDKFFKDHQLANEKTQQRTIITKVDGKPTLVLEFVNTENGKYYYLDDNGDQVIPD